MDFIGLCQQLHVPFLQEEPLWKHTTFAIGGRADMALLPPVSMGQGENSAAASLLAAAKGNGIPLRVLGRGSNILAADEGVSGGVLQFDSTGTPMLTEDGLLFCTAGLPLTAVCVFAQRHGLSGLEFAYGIPASVGGALYMNAGAYGGEMKDVVDFAEVLSADGQFHRLTSAELGYGYRHSVFMEEPWAGCVITGGAFRLTKDDPDAIRARMEKHMASRKEKQPLEYPSAGSTFKRPEGAFAAALIDQCGLKGFTVGGAQVSEKHAGFVVNKGGATCADVLSLMKQVGDIVKNQTGFVLSPEVRIWSDCKKEGL